MHVFIQNSQNSIGSKVQKLPDLQSQEVPSYLSPGEHRCDRCAMPPKFNITEMAIYIYIPIYIYTKSKIWFGYGHIYQSLYPRNGLVWIPKFNIPGWNRFQNILDIHSFRSKGCTCAEVVDIRRYLIKTDWHWFGSISNDFVCCFFVYSLR